MRQVWRQLPLLNAQATKVIIGCMTDSHVIIWRCAAAQIVLHTMSNTCKCRLRSELHMQAPPRKEALAKWPPRRKLAVGEDPVYGLLYPACAPNSSLVCTHAPADYAPVVLCTAQAAGLSQDRQTSPANCCVVPTAGSCKQSSLPRLRCWGLLYGLRRMLLLHLLHLDLLQLLLLHLRSGESRKLQLAVLCYSDAIVYI